MSIASPGTVFFVILAGAIAGEYLIFVNGGFIFGILIAYNRMATISKMNNKKKLLLVFIDREKPLTWVFAIVIAMLIIPLVVTFILILVFMIKDAMKLQQRIINMS